MVGKLRHGAARAIGAARGFVQRDPGVGKIAWQLCSSMPRPQFTGRRVDSSGAGGAGGDEAQPPSTPATMMESIFAFIDFPFLSSKQVIDSRILTALLFPVPIRIRLCRARHTELIEERIDLAG